MQETFLTARVKLIITFLVLVSFGPIFQRMKMVENNCFLLEHLMATLLITIPSWPLTSVDIKELSISRCVHITLMVRYTALYLHQNYCDVIHKIAMKIHYKT